MSNWVAIAKTTVSSGSTAGVTFGSIQPTSTSSSGTNYDVLRVMWTAFSEYSSYSDDLIIYVNNVTSSGYYYSQWFWSPANSPSTDTTVNQQRNNYAGFKGSFIQGADAYNAGGANGFAGGGFCNIYGCYGGASSDRGDVVNYLSMSGNSFGSNYSSTSLNRGTTSGGAMDVTGGTVNVYEIDLVPSSGAYWGVGSTFWLYGLRNEVA